MKKTNINDDLLRSKLNSYEPEPPNLRFGDVQKGYLEQSSRAALKKTTLSVVAGLGVLAVAFTLYVAPWNSKQVAATGAGAAQQQQSPESSNESSASAPLEASSQGAGESRASAGNAAPVVEASSSGMAGNNTSTSAGSGNSGGKNTSAGAAPKKDAAPASAKALPSRGNAQNQSVATLAGNQQKSNAAPNAAGNRQAGNALAAGAKQEQNTNPDAYARIHKTGADNTNTVSGMSGTANNRSTTRTKGTVENNNTAKTFNSNSNESAQQLASNQGGASKSGSAAARNQKNAGNATTNASPLENTGSASALKPDQALASAATAGTNKTSGNTGGKQNTGTTAGPGDPQSRETANTASRSREDKNKTTAKDGGENAASIARPGTEAGAGNVSATGGSTVIVEGKNMESAEEQAELAAMQKEPMVNPNVNSSPATDVSSMPQPRYNLSSPHHFVIASEAIVNQLSPRLQPAGDYSPVFKTDSFSYAQAYFKSSSVKRTVNISPSLQLGYYYKNLGVTSGVSFFSYETKVNTAAMSFRLMHREFDKFVVRDSMQVVNSVTVVNSYTLPTYKNVPGAKSIVVNGDTVSAGDYVSTTKFLTIPLAVSYQLGFFDRGLIIEPVAGVQFGIPMSAQQLVAIRPYEFIYTKNRKLQSGLAVLYDFGLKLQFRLSGAGYLYVKQGYAFTNRPVSGEGYLAKTTVSNLYTSFGISIFMH